MNVRHLTEMAGVLSVHAPRIVESSLIVSADSLERVVSSSRKRSEAWLGRMRDLKTGADCWPALYDGREARKPLIEEILVSELHARMACGILAAHGQSQGEKRICRATDDLFRVIQESRRLALRQMLEMAEDERPVVRKLDRLRRLCERWTDMLLGTLHCRYGVRHLTFDPAASWDFGQAITPHVSSGTAERIISAGIRVAIPQTLVGVPAHAELHQEFAESLLSILPHKLFDEHGLPSQMRHSSQAKIQFRSLRRRQDPPNPL